MSDPSQTVAFHIDGMDCAQEVAVLKRVVGPLVGGEAGPGHSDDGDRDGRRRYRRGELAGRKPALPRSLRAPF